MVDSLPRLEALETSLPSLEHAALDNIQAAQLPTLRTLKLCIGPCSASHNNLFQKCANLTNISIIQSTQSELTHSLFTLNHLECLELCRCNIVSSDQAVCFRKFAKLKHLRLIEVLVEPSATRAFAEALSFTSLEHLEVHGEFFGTCWVTDILEKVSLRSFSLQQRISLPHLEETMNQFSESVTKKCALSRHMDSFQINSIPYIKRIS